MMLFKKATPDKTAQANDESINMMEIGVTLGGIIGILGCLDPRYILWRVAVGLAAGALFEAGKVCYDHAPCRRR